MPRPKTIRQCKKLCSGCRSDRYNQGRGFVERAGIDAPITTDKCWSLDPAKALYVRGAKTWTMPCHDGLYQRWLTQWNRTGTRPTWRY